MKQVFVATDGCPENRIDAARMQECFKNNGWTLAHDYRDADLILFNACAHTEDTEELSIKIIEEIKREKKHGARLVVCGCLPKINEKRLREVYDGFTFGSDEIEQLTEIVEAKTPPETTRANYLIPLRNKWRVPDLRNRVGAAFLVKTMYLALMALRHPHSEAINVYNPRVFCIKVSTGCLNACSFCGIRLSRGKLKSKPVSEVIEEFKDGLSKGFKQFALIGTDLGAYGIDLGTDLARLLAEITNTEGDYALKLRNIQPRYLAKMLPELKEVFKTGKIAYFGAALESGSDRILHLMRRGYTTEEFKNAILTLRAQSPETKIRTQVIIGFPTETDQDFRGTLRVLAEVDFDFVEVYLFQARPETEAATIEGHVHVGVARKRFSKVYFNLIMNELKWKKRTTKAIR